MTNPMGMAQVDIPALYGLYATMRQQRLNELYKKKEEDRQDRKEKREDDERAAYAKVFDETAPRAVPTTPDGRYKLSDVMPAASPAASPYGKLGGLVGLGSNKGGIGGAMGGGSVPASAPLPYDPTIPSGSPLSPARYPETPVEAVPEAMAEPAALSGDLAPPAGAETPRPSGGLSINPDGLRELAKFNPKLAMDLSKANDEQREAAFKHIKGVVEFESQIIGSVMRVPEQDRPATYQRIRADLEARGMQGLPAQWDEQDAAARQAMGLTAMQAFQDDRAERRLAWDVEDDEADNARADRNTDSLIDDRGQRRGLVVRGQDIRSGDTRRGQDLTDKRARERPAKKPGAAPVRVRSIAEARSLKPGTHFITPDGQEKVR